MTFAEYMVEAMMVHAAHRNWRLGQSLFNVLAEQRPELAEKVRGTTSDPFYADHFDQTLRVERYANFLLFVEKEWN